MRPLAFVLFVALPLLLGAGRPAPPHNVLVSRQRTEPVVAVSPSDPSLIVAGANTSYIGQQGGPFPVAFFTSHDTGKTFSVGALPLLAPYITGADPSVAIAQDGTIFYSYLAESATYCSGGPGAILLAHSIDQGMSFRGPVVVDSNLADDRPTLAVESMRGASSHVFVAWTRSYGDHSEIWLARSLDGGATFQISMLFSSPSDNFGAEPVIGDSGHIYVFWLSHHTVARTAAGPAQVLLTASGDDGLHFGPVHGAGHGFTNLPELAQPGSLRDLTMPAAASAPSGALYVAYAATHARHADGSIDADIWLTRSLDHGAAWSAPERVNDDRSGDRFMPELSVLPGGSIAVAFYDRRSGPGDLGVYAARVSFAHGFKATQNVRVNAAPSPIADISYFNGDESAGDSCFPSGRFFGDYIGTAGDGLALATVWADAHSQQKAETDIWFAKVELPPNRPHPARASPQKKSHASTWSQIMSGPRSVLLWFSDMLGGVIPGGLSGFQALFVCGLFLLPILALATAVMSLRRSSQWQ